MQSKLVLNRWLVGVLAFSLGACAVDVGEPDDEADNQGVVESEVTAPTQSGNYIGNASFENSVLGAGGYGVWAQGENSSGDRTYASPHSGTYALFVKAASASADYYPYFWQFAKIPGGKTYTLSAWARASSGGGNQVMTIHIYRTGSGATISKQVSAGTSTTWHKVSITFTAPSDIYDVLVYVGNVGATDFVKGGATYWDDVSLRYNL